MSMTWLLKAFITTICFSIFTILVKFLTNKNIPSEAINLYSITICSICFAIFAFYKNSVTSLELKFLPIATLMGLILFIANYYLISAINSAPNPGYVRAILAFEMVVVSILSFFIYSSHLSGIKILGMFFSLLGVVLLAS